MRNTIATLAILVALMMVSAGPVFSEVDRSSNTTICLGCGEKWTNETVGYFVYDSQKGVMYCIALCTKCLFNPQRIDEDKLNKFFQRYAWPPEEISKVIIAVKKLKLRQKVPFKNSVFNLR